jgi:hypothetical protein
VERLPLNINILYEVVERDPTLANIDFDDEDPECMEGKLCERHDQRVKHFYCSSHLTVFCRECIKELHYEENCFVVDLYEIEKMRKLQIQNMTYNRNQLKKRKDGANQSCVVNEFAASEPKKKQRKPIQKFEVPAKIAQAFPIAAAKTVPTGQPIFLKGKNGIPEYLVKGASGVGEDFLPYDYENEEAPTDEARTNEEAYEDIQQFAFSKYPQERLPGAANCVFFNEEGLEGQEESGEPSSDEQEDEEEEEEGEFDPAIMGHHPEE